MDWPTIISQVAFPICVAIFLLVRLEKALNNLAMAITGQQEVLAGVKTLLILVAERNGVDIGLESTPKPATTIIKKKAE